MIAHIVTRAPMLARKKHVELSRNAIAVPGGAILTPVAAPG